MLKKALVVGQESADVVLTFPTISGSHCELVVEEGIWVVRDLNSNGTK